MRQLVRLNLAFVFLFTQVARADLRAKLAHVVPQPSPALSVALDELDAVIARDAPGAVLFSGAVELRLAHVLMLFGRLNRSDRESAIRALGRVIAEQYPELARALATDLASGESHARLKRFARGQDDVALPTAWTDVPMGVWQMGAGSAGAALLPVTILVMVLGAVVGIAGTLLGEAAATDILSASADGVMATSLFDDEGKKDSFTRRSAKYARGGYLRLTNRRRAIDLARALRPTGTSASSLCAALLNGG